MLSQFLLNYIALADVIARLTVAELIAKISNAITSKYSVVGTLYHRARTICSSPNQLQKEEQHLFKTLRRCKYPTLALNIVKLKNQTPALKKNTRNNNNSDPNNSRSPKPYIVVQYHQGPSESFKGTSKKYGIQVHLKGGPTIKNLLMTPKDNDPILNTSGVIYRYKCNRVECDEEYIGDSARTFAERFKEYLKAPSPIYDHYYTSGHNVTIENFNIVGREDQTLMRNIKEALYIRVNNQSLNRNIGKYHLPHIWDEVLLNSSELKLK